MTRPHFDDSALVEAWLKEPTWLEPVDGGRVAAIVHQTPQVRRWPPHVDLGRFSPMLNASKFVAASVILALVGGLLVMTLPTEPTVEPIPAVETATASVTPTPEATVAETVPATMESNGPTISLPDELPEGTQSGTIETPAGSIRWARVPVTEDTPGYVGSVGPWGDGLVIWGYISPNFSTKDGVIWERLKPPGQVRGLVGDKHVAIDLIQGRPWDPPKDRVWLGSAGSGWQELDASAMAGVPIEGWEQRGRRIESGPMVVDGRTVFMIASQYRLPYAKLGIPTNQRNKTRSMKPLGGGRYALCGSGTGPRSCRQAGADARWILRFEETPGGLRVTNDRTDERLGILEGASADDLYEGGGGARHSYYAIEGDVVVEIESPWPGTSLKQLGRHTVAPGGSEPIRTHWLANGRVPVTAPGVPSIASEVPEGWSLSVSTFPDRLEAYASPGAVRWPVGRAWISTDGIDWIAPPHGVPNGAEARWVGSGWLATKQTKRGTEHWIHVGGEWVSLDALDLPGVPASGYGNATFFGGNGELWVLTHPTDE